MKSVTPTGRIAPTVVLGFLSESEGSLKAKGDGANKVEIIWPFIRTRTITSALAAVPIYFFTDSEVPRGAKPFIDWFVARVNGGTGWGTTATVKVQDNHSSPVAFVTFAVAGLTNQARLIPGSANVTLEDAFSLMTGGTTNKGLQMVGNANGTGSDLVVTIRGFYRLVVNK